MKRKNDNKIILLFILVGIVLFTFLGFKIYNDFFKDNSVKKQIDKIELYGYTLSKNDTSLYKDNFKTLSKILNDKEVNYKEYAKTISKMFVIDLFNLDNKLTSTDIGGVEFIHKDLKDNFKENMGNGMYKFIENNLEGKRKQQLPIVKEINVTDVFETKYKYKSKEYTSYVVKLNWTYEKDMGYQDKISLTLIKEDKMLYVIKGY